jgi:hypothetical protein
MPCWQPVPRGEGSGDGKLNLEAGQLFAYIATNIPTFRFMLSMSRWIHNGSR